jgi:threonylcarbamoyladenosine tRNA methylthiotransferase CDKAL1
MSCGIVDDIEDILKNDSQFNDPDLNRSGNKSYILPKSVINKKSKQELENNDNFNKNESSNIPGLAKIWVKTWGCTHNTSDSEYMAGQLAAYGYKIVGKNKKQKNLIKLNIKIHLN